EDERKIALHRWMPWQRLILRLPQLVFVQPIEVKLGNKQILPQLAPSGVRMNLPELGHSCAIHHRARRTSGVVVLRRVRVVVEGIELKPAEQILDIALDVEK